MSRAICLRFGFLAFMACAVLMGCSSKPSPKSEDPGAVNLRKIGEAYDVFEYRKHRGPKDENELVSVFSEIGHTGDPKELLTSKRDGQPYVIYYGPKMDSDARGFIVAHERNGADGKRFVLTLDRLVKEMTDEEFATAKFANSWKPQQN